MGPGGVRVAVGGGQLTVLRRDLLPAGVIGGDEVGHVEHGAVHHYPEVVRGVVGHDLLPAHLLQRLTVQPGGLERGQDGGLFVLLLLRGHGRGREVAAERVEAPQHPGHGYAAPVPPPRHPVVPSRVRGDVTEKSRIREI